MTKDNEVREVTLNTLRPAPGGTTRDRRLGRGTAAGQGRTCGKGHKGQKARAGYSYKPGFEGGQMPIQRRVPKRGFSNYPFRKVYQIVNLKQLDGVFATDQEINPEVLLKAGLISTANVPVKILGVGDVKTVLKLKVHAASTSATEKIKAAGGEVELIC